MTVYYEGIKKQKGDLSLWADSHLRQGKALYQAQRQINRYREWGNIGYFSEVRLSVLASWFEVTHPVIAQLVKAVSDT